MTASLDRDVHGATTAALVHDDDTSSLDSADEWTAPPSSVLKDNSPAKDTTPVGDLHLNIEGNKDSVNNSSKYRKAYLTAAGTRHVLGISQLARTAMTDEERELAGPELLVRFHLPDDTTVDGSFYAGQTVQYVKAKLEELDESLVYERTTLYMNNEMLLDPLSLNDLPFQTNELNEVKVVVADEK